MQLLRNKTPQDFSFPDGSPALFPLKDFSSFLSNRLIFQKGHPIFPQVSKIVQAIFESGIYGHIVLIYNYQTQIKERTSERKKNISKALSYDQIAGILYIWLIGLGVALIIFCIELLHKTNTANL